MSTLAQFDFFNRAVQSGLTEGQFVNATARWSKDDRMGVEFAGAVDLGALRNAPKALAS